MRSTAALASSVLPAAHTDDGALSKHLSGRMSAAIFILSGVVALAGPLVPGFPVLSRLGMVAVGLAAMLIGLITLLLPWDRWRRSRLLILVVPAFILIALLNHFGDADPYRYSLFFMVLFVAVGIVHPPGTCLKILPLMLVTYVVPLLVQDRYSTAAATSVIYAAPVCLMAGETLSWVGTQLRRARMDIVNNQARFRALVMNASDIIVVLDPAGKIDYISPSVASRLAGNDRESIVGESAISLIHPDDQNRFAHFLEACLSEYDSHPVTELRVKRVDGGWRDVEAIGNNLLANPNVGGIVVTARDITERKALEQQLTHQAFHDSLTSLPNRALFVDRTEHALTAIGRHYHGIAILFVDLDRFKLINDSLGHEVGDQVLKTIAKRLQDCVRDGDTVARFGGDEFTILLENTTHPSDAVQTADRIVTALKEPLALDGHDIHIITSIGIAWSGSSRDEPEQLLRKADVAMYHAKRDSEVYYRVYEASMDSNTLDRLELENDLRGAIDRNEFSIHYQPKVSLTTSGSIGVEALVRWNHPRRGLLSPQAFIPIAEETGLIVQIGQIVLTEACRQAREWQDTMIGLPPLLMSVNISARQLRQPDIVNDISLILQETGLPAHQLELEITESAMIDDATGTIELLGRLKELGIRLAMDDFGTGYSSLSYLKRFPLDVLKIDRSFVNGLGTGSDDEAIISAIVDVAHSLGLTVVAEGVETEQQLRMLRALGCDIGQGYFLARPLVSVATREFLSRHHGLEPAMTTVA